MCVCVCVRVCACVHQYMALLLRSGRKNTCHSNEIKKKTGRGGITRVIRMPRAPRCRSRTCARAMQGSWATGECVRPNVETAYI